MKITDVKTFLVHDQERPRRNYTFVKIYTDEGLTGLGEAGINGKELALKGLVETYRPILVGMDPARIEHIWQTLWRGQFFRGGHVHSATVAAIDLALWDVRGKALGVPVYDLLGGRTRDYARCYCHVQRPHDGDGRRAGIDEMVQYAKARVSEGWRFVRFGAGEGRAEVDHGVYEQSAALRWTVDAFAALRDALARKLKSASISTSGPRPPTPSKWRASSLRCGLFSLRTPCGRRTRRNLPTCALMFRCRSPLENNWRASGNGKCW